MTEMEADIVEGHNKAASLRHFCCACLVGCITFAVYWPVHAFEFLNFDDDQYIVENPFVRSGLTWDNVRAAFSQARGGHYHPVTWVSHMLDVTAFGLEPGPAHVVNAALHATATALAFGFALRCARVFASRTPRASDSVSPVWVALSVALIFGLHPLRLESVAWLAERKDVLSVNFALLSLHAWLFYQERPLLRRYLSTAMLFGLGLLCKPTLVTLPVLFLGLDYWLLPNRPNVAKLTLEKLPLLLMALASVVATTASQHQDGALQAFSLSTMGDRLTTAAIAYLAYFGKLFWPAGLGVFYPWVAHPPGVGIGAVCGLIALTWLIVVYRDRAPGLAFGWFWFLVAPLPVIGLVQFGGQAFADRWTYLPHLGLVVGLCVTVANRLRLNHFQLAIAAVVTLLGAVTATNLPHWRHSEALFRHTLEVAPNNFLAHTNLGNALDAKGRLDEATFHYEAAVRLNPTYPEALNNLGTARARAGRFAEAEQSLGRALELRPGLLLAGYNLGLVQAQRSRQLEAATTWLELLRREPEEVRTLKSLSSLVDRYLLPACSAQTLDAPESARQEFLARYQRVQLSDANQRLSEHLRMLATCLATLAQSSSSAL